MATTADSLITRFFTRRDEQIGEVFSKASAVGFINEAQQELIGLKLIRKVAELTFLADTAELSLPSDFSVIKSDRAYMGSYAYLWLPYDGPTAEGLFLVPGGETIRLYPAPTVDTPIEFEYFANPTTIPDAPTSETVMSGLNIPSLDLFFLYTMLESAALVEDEAGVAEAYRHRAEKAMSDIVVWKSNTYGTDQSCWVEDPMWAAQDDYVSEY